MKKIVFLLILFYSVCFSSELKGIKLTEYIGLVSSNHNVSFVVDDSIDKDYTIYLSSKLSDSSYFDILRTILNKNNMLLKYYKNHYYISKKTIDTSPKNKVYSVKVDYLNEDDIKGIMSLYNYKYNYIKSLKTIFIDCSFNELQQIVLIFKRYDIIPFQKKLKITILDTNLNKLKDYGIENSINISSDSNTSFFFNLLAFPFSIDTTLNTIQKTNFTSYIKLMNENNITNVVSSPSMSIFDNKKSIFEVVKNIPYRTGETSINENTTQTTSSIEYKDIGLKLEVLPIINKDSAFIDLTLSIENILDNSDTPVTSKKHIKQYVNLKDNEVFVLNGINQTESYNDDFKTPFLSDIPYVGWLFKNEYENIKTTNLTILLELVN